MKEKLLCWCGQEIIYDKENNFYHCSKWKPDSDHYNHTPYGHKEMWGLWDKEVKNGKS
jgi:hypothetical protein